MTSEFTSSDPDAQPSARMASSASCRLPKIAPFSDDLGDPVASHVRQQVGVDAPEDDLNALAGKLLEQGANGLRRGKVHVCDRFRVEKKPFDRLGRFFDQLANLIGEMIGVGVKKVRAVSIDDQSRSGLQPGRSRHRLPFAARVSERAPANGPR